MKAIVCERYGSPDVLELKEIAKPVPNDDEVLIKVSASSVNSWDWDFLRGKPRLYRLLFGILKPKFNVLGADIAGRVEAIGKKVKQLKVGDEVFGDISAGNWGGFGEFVCASETALAIKSASMTFEQAAAIPQAGVLALQGLRDNGQPQRGQKVLINGAGGGVGTFAVQMAKSLGAEVTAVDSTPKLEMLRSIGADHVIDYTKEDFTKNGQRYDFILDVMAYRSIFDYKRALNPEGIYVMVGGSIGRILQLACIGPIISWFGGKRMGLLVHKPNKKDLNLLTDLFESGKVVPVIDRCYPLAETAKALQHLGDGHSRGKVVISISDIEFKG